MKNVSVETKFDDQFLRIEKLKWLPWVGKEYCHLPVGKKLLIVGESHYIPSIEQSWYKDVETRGFTRQFILSQIPNNDMEKVLLNFQKILLSDEPSGEQKFKLWDSISYYNFIQKALASSKQEDRPTPMDFEDGWYNFFKLIDILNPDFCLFGGVAATYYSDKFMETARENEFTYDNGIVKVDFLSSGVSARKVSISKNGKVLPILFILHPTSWQHPFKSSDWRKCIDQQMGDYTTWIRGERSTNA